MTLTSSDLDHVIELARLDIPETEKTLYLGQLQKILDSMAALDKLDLSGVEPTFSTSQSVNLRPDIDRVFDVTPSEIAPLWEENGFQVPKILDEEA